MLKSGTKVAILRCLVGSSVRDRILPRTSLSKDTPITLKCRQWLIHDYDYDTFELILKLGEPQVNRKNGTINLMGLEKHSFDNWSSINA